MGRLDAVDLGPARHVIEQIIQAKIVSSFKRSKGHDVRHPFGLRDVEVLVSDSNF